MLVCGQDLVASELAAKKNLAWIPDDPQPFDSLTVIEHMRFTAALYGVDGWEPRAERLLALFELSEKRTRFGKIFYSCTRYPICKYAIWDKPLKGRNTSMPWRSYAGMTDQDLGAIYDYLKTVKPIPGVVNPFPDAPDMHEAVAAQ